MKTIKINSKLGRLVANFTTAEIGQWFGQTTKIDLKTADGQCIQYAVNDYDGNYWLTNEEDFRRGVGRLHIHSKLKSLEEIIEDVKVKLNELETADNLEYLLS